LARVGCDLHVCGMVRVTGRLGKVYDRSWMIFGGKS